MEAALELEIPVLLAHKSYDGSRSSRATYEALLGREITKLEDLPPEEYGKRPLTMAWWAMLGKIARCCVSSAFMGYPSHLYCPEEKCR